MKDFFVFEQEDTMRVASVMSYEDYYKNSRIMKIKQWFKNRENKNKTDSEQNSLENN